MSKDFHFSFQVQRKVIQVLKVWKFNSQLKVNSWYTPLKWLYLVYHSFFYTNFYILLFSSFQYMIYSMHLHFCFIVSSLRLICSASVSLSPYSQRFPKNMVQLIVILMQLIMLSIVSMDGTPFVSIGDYCPHQNYSWSDGVPHPDPQVIHNISKLYYIVIYIS